MSRNEGRDVNAAANMAAQAQAGAVEHVVHTARAVAVIDARSIIGAQCPTCDGFMCLDCVDGNDHDKCTRACPECLIENVDWDESLEMSQIATELRGLHALDDAIRQAERDGAAQAEQTERAKGWEHGRGDLSA